MNDETIAFLLGIIGGILVAAVYGGDQLVQRTGIDEIALGPTIH